MDVRDLALAAGAERVVRKLRGILKAASLIEHASGGLRNNGEHVPLWIGLAQIRHGGADLPDGRSRIARLGSIARPLELCFGGVSQVVLVVADRQFVILACRLGSG